MWNLRTWSLRWDLLETHAESLELSIPAREAVHHPNDCGIWTLEGELFFDTKRLHLPARDRMYNLQDLEEEFPGEIEEIGWALIRQEQPDKLKQVFKGEPEIKIGAYARLSGDFFHAPKWYVEWKVIPNRLVLKQALYLVGILSTLDEPT